MNRREQFGGGECAGWFFEELTGIFIIYAQQSILSRNCHHIVIFIALLIQ